MLRSLFAFVQRVYLHTFTVTKNCIHDRIQNEQFKKALPKSAAGLVFTLLQNKHYK